MASLPAGGGLRSCTPWPLPPGALAGQAPDAANSWRLLDEGEAELRNGSVSHNHFYFYRLAMEIALNHEDWERAERFADSPEAFTRPEPVPFCEYFIARARTLAEHGRGRGNRTLSERLAELTGQGRKAGFL